MESDAVTTKTRESIGRYGVEVYCYGTVRVCLDCARALAEGE
jgi:hypothetical protein